jgi:hypothetical protein
LIALFLKYVPSAPTFNRAPGHNPGLTNIKQGWRDTGYNWRCMSERECQGAVTLQLQYNLNGKWRHGIWETLTWPMICFDTCCKIWGFHGGDYDDYHLLRDDTHQLIPASGKNPLHQTWIGPGQQGVEPQGVISQKMIIIFDTCCWRRE